MDLQWKYEGRPNRINTSELARLVGNDRDLGRDRAAAWTRRRPCWLTSYSDVHVYGLLSKGTLPTRLAHITGGEHGLASLYWYEWDDLIGRNALLVTEKEGVAAKIAPYCRDVETLEPNSCIVRGDQLVRSVSLFRCHEVIWDGGAFTR